MGNVAQPIVATLIPVRAQVTTRDVRMQLGPYRIIDILGEGATGIVYRAADPHDRELAIKVLREELALSDRERARFLAEADRLRRVRHRALVEVVDAGVFPNGTPYIAMPFLHGTSLAERLQRGPMRFDVALQLFEQLADALQMLHREGLVHRDIKPENIFVTEGDGQAMLLDLGIARDVSSGPSTTTHAGMIRGTPAYMAPERFFGAPATPATDIYELGVVLYVTLVGALPWTRFDDPTERMRPATPASRGVVLPPRLSSTLMRALAASPGERPTSAHDFSSAVIDALSPESAHQISNQATAFLPSHMAVSKMTGSARASPAANHADVFAPTTMAPVGASGVRSVTGPMPQWGHASTGSPPQMHVPPQLAPAPVRKGKGPPTLLIAAMTGASLLGAGGLALALFLPHAGSSPSAVAVPVASAASVPSVVVAVAPAQSAAPGEDQAEARKARTATAGPSPRKPRELETKAKSGPVATASVSANGVSTPTAASSASSAPSVKPAPLLPHPPPNMTPSTRMENCANLANYECAPSVKAIIGGGECASSMMTLSTMDKANPDTRISRDGLCRMKLVGYQRRFDAQQAKK